MSDQHDVDKFEETDWELKPVAISVIGLLLLMFFGLVCGWIVVETVRYRHDRTVLVDAPAAIDSVPIVRNRAPLVEEPSIFTQKRLPPGPRLQVDEAHDLKELRDREAKLLSSYEYLDKSAGTVRIPIDRAIELVAEEQGRGR